jgi:hypothetical protein
VKLGVEGCKAYSEKATGQEKKLMDLIVKSSEAIKSLTIEQIEAAWHDGATYNLREFLIIEANNFNAWQASLRESAEYGAIFNLNFNYHDSNWKKFVKNYVAPSPKIKKSLDKISKYTKKSYEWVPKINEADSSSKLSQYKRAEARFFERNKKSFISSVDLITPLLTAIDVKEQNSFNHMNTIFNQTYQILLDLKDKIKNQMLTSKRFS